MQTVIKLDEERRGVFPEPFKAGDTLMVDALGPEAISLHLVKPDESPTAEPRRLNGRLFGAKLQPNRAEIAAAVRADRDAR
jgi:hypothetical protein